MDTLKTYLITFLNHNGEEEIEPVDAYSEEQAVLLAKCSVSDILDIELAVAHKYAASGGDI